MINYKPLLTQAIDIAERASRIAYSFFRQALLIEMKENNTPVTVADKKTEEFIRKELEKKFSEHAILGEEFGETKKNSAFKWTIDPIDGTRSFIRGIPLFGTLLGLLENNAPVIGVMVLPALNETYAAALNQNTTCNGNAIRVSNAKSVKSAVMGCGDISYFEMAGKRKYFDAILDKAELVRGYTDCFGHSLVMRGALDAMIDPYVSLWDVVPLACLVENAGGTYFTFEGEKTHTGTSFITSTPFLKEELLKLYSTT